VQTNQKNNKRFCSYEFQNTEKSYFGPIIWPKALMLVFNCYLQFSWLVTRPDISAEIFILRQGQVDMLKNGRWRQGQVEMLIMVVKDRVSKEAFNSFCLINIKDKITCHSTGIFQEKKIIHYLPTHFSNCGSRKSKPIIF